MAHTPEEQHVLPFDNAESTPRRDSIRNQFLQMNIPAERLSGQGPGTSAVSTNPFADRIEQIQARSAKRGSKSEKVASGELQKRPATSNVRQLSEASEQEQAEAAEAGISFLMTTLVQATLPHREPRDAAGVPIREYTRRSGQMDLTLWVPPKVGGLPYGRHPRLFTIWLSSYVKRRGERELVFEDSYSEFMRQIGVNPTSGPRGSRNQFRTQVERLFATTFNAIRDYPDGKRLDILNSQIATQASLWWQKGDDSDAPEGLYVRLHEDFYNQIMRSSIPIRTDVILGLRSCLEIDAYAWLSYRMATLQRPSLVRWEDLQQQFGTGIVRLKDFKDEFKRALGEVRKHYSGAKYTVRRNGLLLLRGRPDVPRASMKLVGTQTR